MIIKQICENRTFYSNSDGTELATTIEDLVLDALGAMSASVYVKITHDTSDTNIKVQWAHSPTGHDFTDGTGDLYAGTAVPSGLKAPTAVTDVRVASKMRLIMKVSQGTPATQRTIQVSIWIVLKPF